MQRKAADEFPPKSQSFEDLQELCARARDDLNANSPVSVMSCCSADEVMLKRRSSVKFYLPKVEAYGGNCYSGATATCTSFGHENQNPFLSLLPLTSKVVTLQILWSHIEHSK